MLISAIIAVCNPDNCHPHLVRLHDRLWTCGAEMCPLTYKHPAHHVTYPQLIWQLYTVYTVRSMRVSDGEAIYSFLPAYATTMDLKKKQLRCDRSLSFMFHLRGITRVLTPYLTSHWQCHWTATECRLSTWSELQTYDLFNFSWNNER